MQEKYTLNTALAAVVGLGCLAAVLYRVFLSAAVLPAVGLPAAAACSLLALAAEAYLSKGVPRRNWGLTLLLGGGVMLGALFMATDYATSPALPAAQLVYGVGCGALTVLFRYFGLYPEGVTYAILLMNACAWALDKALPPVRFGAVRGGKAG